MSARHEKKIIKKPKAPPYLKTTDSARKQPPAETKKKVSTSLKAAFLLGLISCMVYANTIRNGFVLDDYSVITGNTIVTKGIVAIPELMTTPHMRGFFITSHDIYRPLSLVMFAVEYQFFGANPLPYHLFNILLFAACVILLFFFLDKLFYGQKATVAFIASLLFALHPIHTEVVANIKSRDELLCFFFAFVCLNLFTSFVQNGNRKYLVWGGVCFLLALLSKETVITFLGFIPLVFFFYHSENKDRSKQLTYIIGIAAVIFLLAKFAVLSYYHANESTYVNFIDNALAKRDLLPRLRTATAIFILGYYLRLLFIPYPLICDYSFNSIPIVDFDNPIALLSMACYIFLFVYGIRRFIKNKKDPFVLWIFYFLFTMSLFTNILFLLGTAMGERLLFFPSVAFCVILSLVLELVLKLPGNPALITTRQRSLLVAILLPVCIAYSCITINRNGEWTDNYTLYEADSKKSPHNSKIYFDLGCELSKHIYAAEPDTAKKKLVMAEAILCLEKSLGTYPEYEDANTELGASYFRLAQYDSAEKYESRTLQINGKNTMAINNLAAVYFLKKRYKEAIAMYKNAIDLEPGFINPYANIGLCYQYTGMYDSTIYYLEKAIAINPKFSLSYEILSTTYKLTGNLELARKYEAIAQKNNPGFKM